MRFSFNIDKRMTPRNRFIVNFIGEVGDKEILDIGCSYGWLEKTLLEKKMKCPKKIVGIEPKNEYFHQAFRRVPRAKFVVGSALDIPFNDGSFDITTMLETLEHLPNKTEKIALKEIYRILRPRGELFLSTPNAHPISCLLDPAWFFGHRHYKAGNLKDWLSEIGFEVNEVFYYGRFWELARMIPHYFFKWVFNIEDPLSSFFQKKIANDGKKTNGYAYIYLKATKK